MAKYSKNLRAVAQAFDRETLARVCVMDETDFASYYDMRTVFVDQPRPDHFYCFQDNGSDVLAVAHLDTVGMPHQRAAHFVETEAGEVVYSRALDDRLGAYIILELLPLLGIQYDILLTVGEESGSSTAAFFDAAPGKVYNRVIEFDRGGTDVVLYDFEDQDLIDTVRATGAKVGQGIFSDICYLEHLGVKAVNWGVGYRDYHGPRAHAYLDDTFEMVARYLKYHQQNEGIHMPHEAKNPDPWFNREPHASSLTCIWDGDELVGFSGRDPWDGAYDDDPAYAEDPDYIEYPTLEEIQAYEERIDRESGRFDSLDRDWMDGVRAQAAG